MSTPFCYIKIQCTLEAHFDLIEQLSIPNIMSKRICLLDKAILDQLFSVLTVMYSWYFIVTHMHIHFDQQLYMFCNCEAILDNSSLYS
jgi:hypothetical protein